MSEDIYTFAAKHLYPYKLIPRVKDGDIEINARYCPFCKGTTEDVYKFFLSPSKGTFVCLRGHCGRKGTFKELKEYIESNNTQNYEVQHQEQQFKTPATDTIKPLTVEAIKYLEKRGISRQTANFFNVKSKGDSLVFQHVGKADELCLITYRSIKEKAFAAEPNGKQILWNLNNLDYNIPVLITEGHIDAMSLYQAGYPNVASVPFGAGAGGKQQWIDNSWDFLQKVKRFILCLDNDEPGQETTKELIRRLGDYRCATVDLPGKDANEVLQKLGEEALVDSIESAKDVPAAGIVNVAQIKDKPTVGISTGIWSLDRYTECPREGDVTVITGRTGHGKSTFISTLILSAIQHGHAVFAYSGELTQQMFRTWIDSIAAGEGNSIRYRNKWGDIKYKVREDIREKIHRWYDGKLFLFDNSYTTKSGESAILSTAKYCIQRYGCKLIVVDNIMTVSLGYNSDNLYQAQTNFVKEASALAKAYDSHVVLVAHPRKEGRDKEGKQFDLNLDSVSGSANITNLAENVWALQRTEQGLLVTIKKNRHEGTINQEIELAYNPADRRLHEYTAVDHPEYNQNYGWEKT